MRPFSSSSRGARLRMPSGSGAAFRKPEAPAACASALRLQTAPVARKNGASFVSSLVDGDDHDASGRRLHGSQPQKRVIDGSVEPGERDRTIEGENGGNDRGN